MRRRKTHTGFEPLPEPERERVDGGVLPPSLGGSSRLPFAVAVDGTDIGAELKRAQVTRYPSLRLPSSGRSTSTGVLDGFWEVSDGASFCLRARNPGGDMARGRRVTRSPSGRLSRRGRRLGVASRANPD
jgi:hypothetical protein